MKTLFTFALVCIFLLSGAPQSNAQDIGLQVKSIPKGTVAHYIDSDGQKSKWVFKGKFQRGYLIQVLGTPNYQRYYNQNGLLLFSRIEGIDLRYVPYFCARKLGKCRFNYDTEYSEYSGSWDTTMTKTKQGYAFRMVSTNKSRDKKSTSYYKFGKYNFIQEFVAGSYWERLVKIVEPK